MKILQILLMGVALVFWIRNLILVFRARSKMPLLSRGRVWASFAILILIIGLILPWSAFPPALGQRQMLTENLEEIDSVILLILVVLASWIVYSKRERSRQRYSLALALLGLILSILVWLAFVFDEQKTSLISANEAYISTLIQPSFGYFLSIIGSITLLISGLLNNPSSMSSLDGTSQADKPNQEPH